MIACYVVKSTLKVLTDSIVYWLQGKGKFHSKTKNQPRMADFIE